MVMNNQKSRELQVITAFIAVFFIINLTLTGCTAMTKSNSKTDKRLIEFRADQHRSTAPSAEEPKPPEWWPDPAPSSTLCRVRRYSTGLLHSVRLTGTRAPPDAGPVSCPYISLVSHLGIVGKIRILLLGILLRQSRRAFL